jgi:hypothetical protein
MDIERELTLTVAPLHCWKSADSLGVWIRFAYVLLDPALYAGLHLMGDEKTHAGSNTATPKYS